MAYDDRVKQAADYIEQSIDDGTFEPKQTAAERKEEFIRLVKNWARSANTYEYIKSAVSNSPGDLLLFLKDVQAEAKARSVDFPKAVAPKKNKDELLQKIANLITDAVSNSVPDGDPIDAIMQGWGRATGEPYSGQYVGDILDRAAKKFLGAKSYNDYVADVWDDYAGMTPDIELGKNPWR